MQSQAPHRTFVPAASRRVHILAASVMWSAAGTGLLVMGSHWILSSHSALAIPFLAASILAGWAKARFVLERTAMRTLDRIESRGDGRCLGGFLSWKSWLLVASMILLGRLLRSSPLPVLYRGMIYAAIGGALLIASRLLWAGWRRQQLDRSS